MKRKGVGALSMKKLMYFYDRAPYILRGNQASGLTS